MRQALLLVALLPALAYGRPGELDDTFGFRGRSELEMPGATSIEAADVAVLTDGTLLLVGRASLTPNFDDVRGLLLRVHADGSLDQSFGQSGFVLSPSPAAGAFFRRVHVFASGDFLVAGWVGLFGERRSLLQRYHADGTLDATFGTGGSVVTTFNEDQDQFSDLAVQPDGKIVAAGFSAFIDPFYLRESAVMTLARFTATGSPDTAFGFDGALIEIAGDWTSMTNGLALQADGKIVVTGMARDDIFGVDDMVVARYLANGDLDTGFGGTGIVRTRVGHDSTAYRVLLQPDGKIVAAGASYEHSPLAWDVTTTHRLALWRLLADGTLDSAFGTAGAVSTNAISNGPGDSGSYGTDALLDLDGRVVVLGDGFVDEGVDSAGIQAVLARYDAVGALDAGFGSGGIVLTPPKPPASTWTVVRQPDGKLVVSSQAFDASGSGHVVLTRYGGTGTDCSTGGPWPDGDGDGVCDANDDCPTDANADQANADLDATGDVCDPCTPGRGATAVKAKLALAKLNTPPGDDKLKLTGTISIPVAVPVDPSTNGMRVVLVDRHDTVIEDRPIAGGAYDDVLRRGWTAKVTPSSTSFKYVDKSGTSDIAKASFKTTAAKAGLWAVKVSGKNGAYPVAAASLPVSATVVLDAGLGSTACGEWLFLSQLAEQATCVPKPTGASVLCK